tara:strand:- start:3202 stop:3477 length:276 start_codon:yes stop_codon:yes gene_type:complete
MASEIPGSFCLGWVLGHFSRTRQTIKWTHSSCSSITNNVGVDFSRPNIAVAEDFLIRSDITSRSQQFSGKGVAKGLRRHPFGYSAGSHGLP